jgi:hypothetical protein
VAIGIDKHVEELCRRRTETSHKHHGPDGPPVPTADRQTEPECAKVRDVLRVAHVEMSRLVATAGVAT